MRSRAPIRGAEVQFARDSATRIASHLPVDQPHLAFVNATSQAAFATLDRVAQVGTYAPSVTYPNNGFALALRTIAGAMVKGVGTKVFWVQTGGYDTHAAQNPNQANGSYTGADDDAQRWPVCVLYRPAQSRSALRHTGAAVLGIRPPHQRERQPGDRSRRRECDDGAGRQRSRRYLRHRAQPADGADNPTLENSGNDVHYETDFRSVYAKVIDSWLGGDSVAVLGGNYRSGAPANSSRRDR